MAVITLTTDFGTRDTYVAEMKAAILSITPDVHVIDITHEVAPHDVLEGALALEAAAPWFPRATVHVAVVDPGVGTARRGLVVAAGDQVFVGPDNGLFTPFLGGLSTERLGPRVTDPVLLAWPRPRVAGSRIGGAVVHVDRFGNLVTSIPGDALASLGSSLTVRVGARSLPLVRTYGELARGRPGALVGSRNRLEIAVNAGSAAALLGAGRGTSVVVSRASKPRAGKRT